VNRSFPITGGAGVSTRTLNPETARDVAPAAVGWFSFRQQGSEFTGHSVCLYENKRKFL